MWQLHTFDLNNITVADKEFRFGERDILFSDGSVISQEIAVYTAVELKKFFKFKDGYTDLLNSCGTEEKRNLYLTKQNQAIATGFLTITDLGDTTPNAGLTGFTLTFNQPDTDLRLMAYSLCKWLRKVYSPIDKTDRSKYPELSENFKIGFDLTPLIGFTFYFNDPNIAVAISDYLEKQKNNFPLVSYLE